MRSAKQAWFRLASQVSCCQPNTGGSAALILHSATAFLQRTLRIAGNFGRSPPQLLNSALIQNVMGQAVRNQEPWCAALAGTPHTQLAGIFEGSPAASRPMQKVTESRSQVFWQDGTAEG